MSLENFREFTDLWIVILAIRRSVLVKEPEKPGDEPVDITPKEFAVQTACHEYSGGAFCISGDTLVFSNYKDQRLYKQSLHLKGKLGSCCNAC